MNYSQALDYLKSFEANKIKLGLDRMYSLMELLGNPQKQLRFVHVGGTNGKGSVVNYMSNILQCSGVNTGVFLSPHLVTINEGIVVGGEQIDDISFATVVDEVSRVLNGSVLQEELTKFEVLVAIAILYFVKRQCQIVLLEVGLGGATDATNIIDSPLIAIITKITLDHTDFLGNTIEEIATNKAGIIKSDCKVVLAPQVHQVAQEVIADKCRQCGVDIIKVVPECSNYHYCGAYQSFEMPDIGEITTTLLGEHQIANIATAVEAVKVLIQQGYHISKENIINGIARTRWSCRLELVNDKPMIFIDGGHNLDGVNAVVSFFQAQFPNKKIRLLFGVLKDKEYTLMVGELSKITEYAVVVGVGSYRTANPQEIVQLFRNNGVRSQSCDTLIEGINVVQQCHEEEIILIIGSLYYVGLAKEILQKKSLKDESNTAKGITRKAEELLLKS